MGEEGLWTSEVGLLRLMGHKYESNSLFLRRVIRLTIMRTSLSPTPGELTY